MSDKKSNKPNKASNPDCVCANSLVAGVKSCNQNSVGDSSCLAGIIEIKGANSPCTWALWNCFQNNCPAGAPNVKEANDCAEKAWKKNCSACSKK